MPSRPIACNAKAGKGMKWLRVRSRTARYGTSGPIARAQPEKPGGWKIRRAAKIDRNQPEIVQALRRLGASVTPTHMVGNGFPDLAIGWKGRNLLWEIKDGLLVPSKQRLTEDEEQWHAAWKGEASIVRSVSDLLGLLSL